MPVHSAIGREPEEGREEGLTDFKPGRYSLIM